MARSTAYSLTLSLRGLLLACLLWGPLGTIACSQVKEFANREEGTVRPHGSSDLELISLVRSAIDYSPNSNLSVRFFLPDASETGGNVDVQSVRIEAREILVIRNYFMRSKAFSWKAGSWNDFEPWPSSIYLDHLVRPGNLAVLASYALPVGQLVYLPAYLSTPNAPPISSINTFVFTTSRDLHSVRTELLGPSGRREPLGTDECKAFPDCVLYGAASHFSITIDMAHRAPGLYKITLTTRVPSEPRGPNATFFFFHPQSGN